ncbi:MAG: hypothetical protein JOZ97_02575 [Candidatus Eremiobacteraeota bacterium]|nr:hypothetical protein [Candidatus Eremiobacteraeota bacterium]
MISVREPAPRRRRWQKLVVFLSSSTLLHLTLLPLLITLLGLRIFLPKFEPEIYHVSSSAIRIERVVRPMTHATPQRHSEPHIVHNKKPRVVSHSLAVSKTRPQVTRPPIPIVAPAPARISPRRVAQHQLIDPKSLEAQQRMYAATIAAAQAANNPLSISKVERAPTATTRVNYNFAGSQAASRHGDGILYPVKRWTQGRVVYYLLRYTVHYASGDYEAGDVPWPVHYTIGADPFAQGSEGERIPLPGPSPDFVASADTMMKPLIAHCYRLRQQYCDIMPSPE